MKNFNYKKPKNLKEANQLLKAGQQVFPYAGGTDLLGLIKDGILQPRELVDIKGLPGLDKISYSPGKGLVIGAAVPAAEVAGHALIEQKYPVLAQAARAVASPQLRNTGTIGGNLCQRPRCWYFRGDFNCLRKGGDTCYAVEGENKFHCVIGGGPCFIVHPSDTAVALLALDAEVAIFSGKKTKQVGLKDFFVLPDKEVTKENILQPGDILTGIHVPDAAADMHGKFLKYTERGVWDFATVSGAVVYFGDKKKVKKGKIILGGVAPIPWFEEEASAALTGVALDTGTIDKLAAKVLQDAEPMTQNEFKITLACNLVKSLLL